MRRPIVVLGALGVVLLTAAALWLLFAPGAFVKYPDDLEKTAVAKGTVNVYVDPETGAPAPAPQALPLTIKRNLRVIESTGSKAVVLETSTEQIGPQKPFELRQQFVLDRSSLKNRSGPQSYSYIPDNVVNRSGAYSINLPFSAGDGPYPIWKNETATSYSFRQSGDEIERDGLTLKPMTGRIVGAPATQAYIDQLAGQGIRKELPIEQLAPQVGIDPAALEQLLPALSGADRAALQAMLAAPVPIKYVVSVDARLLVEPKTGAIVSLDHIEQTLSALPDLSNLAGLGTMLSKPEYADNEVVQAALQTIKGLTGMLPFAVMKLDYGQTPASVADIAAYTEDKAQQIDLVALWIPLGIAIVGAVALIIAAAMQIATPARARAVA